MTRAGIAILLLLVYLAGALTASTFWGLRSNYAQAAQARLSPAVRQLLEANCTKDDLRVALQFFHAREALRRAIPRSRPYPFSTPDERSEAIWVTQCLIYFAIPN